MAPPVIETDRLVLRAFREDDLDAYAEMGQDPDVMGFLSADGSLLTRADAWRQMAMFLGHWPLGWTHLVSLVHQGNQRSAQLAERLGYHLHGTAEVRGLRLRMYRLDRPPC